jgi:transcriptional regulator with XRE-family HTH domain
LQEPYVKIAEMIRNYRENKGLTQLELATKVGYGGSVFISLIERKQSKVPLKTLGRIIKILGLPEKELIALLIQGYIQDVQVEIRSGMREKSL